MNRRILLNGFVVVVCLATLWGGWTQRRQLAGLRAEQQQLLAELAARADGATSTGTAEATGASPATPQPALVVTPDLLRLRNQVTRLTERRRELGGAQAENERLRAQLASRGMNSLGGYQPPAGYMRRSEARMVGYNTPDDTLQSLLWAVQNHDLTNLLQAFTPEIAEEIRGWTGESPPSGGDFCIEDFWSDAASSVVGLRIVSREQDASDGSITIELEVIPGEPGPHFTLRQIDGQWKIAGHF